MAIELTVEIGAGDDENGTMLDRRCRELADDLRRVRGVAVAPVRVDGTPGTKSGIVELIGTIAVSGLTVAAVKVIGDVIVAYLNRSGASSITIRQGDKEVVVQGKPSAEQEEMVRRLLGEPE